MEKVDFQSVITILEKVKNQSSSEFDCDQISTAIDDLEAAKGKLSKEQDDAIDMIDEVQDYLEYLLNSDEAVAADELKEEINDMIDDLRQYSK